MLSRNLKNAVFQPSKRFHIPQKECLCKPLYLIGAKHWRLLSLGSYFTAVVAAAPVAAAVLVKPHSFTIHFSLGVATYTPAPCLDFL